MICALLVRAGAQPYTYHQQKYILIVFLHICIFYECTYYVILQAVSTANYINGINTRLPGYFLSQPVIISFRHGPE